MENLAEQKILSFLLEQTGTVNISDIVNNLEIIYQKKIDYGNTHRKIKNLERKNLISLIGGFKDQKAIRITALGKEYIKQEINHVIAHPPIERDPAIMNQEPMNQNDGLLWQILSEVLSEETYKRKGSFWYRANRNRSLLKEYSEKFIKKYNRK